MPSFLRHVFLTAVACTAAATASALSPNDAGDLVRAQILINKVLQVVDKYRQFTVVLEAPQPISGNTGKYLLPYRANGAMTEWAGKNRQRRREQDCR
ncbi:MAG: hypothetical protein C0518_03175 [Opitutus sp.]|nr:hypothetical protein [Opitutus sp.]